jgi:hypothetical protein
MLLRLGEHGRQDFPQLSSLRRRCLATRSIQLIYLAALVAAVVRVAVAFGLMREPMLHLSATAWGAASGGFVMIYAPLLCTTRRA